MALKIFFFLRSYHPPHIFPVKRALFQALFCWVGKSIMRMQIRGEKCKSPFPSHLVSFDFCAFWKFVRFSQPFKKTGGRKEYGEKLGKEVCRLFSFFPFSRSFSTRGALSFRRRFKPRKSRGPSCSIAQCMHVESSYPNVAFLNTVHSKSDRKKTKKGT